MNLFDRLKAGLSRTRSGLVANLESVFASARQLDAAFYEELEDTLIMADVGVATSTALISRLQRSVKEKHLTQPVEVKELLEAEIEALFRTAGAEPFDFQTTQQVYLVVGVNGVGKTTTIAKLAAKFKGQRRQVLLVAGDTFRAAATEQLMLWGERLGIPVIHHQEGADPAAVVFDGLAAGKARQSDPIIVDTAGRLHTKVNLMAELKKVQRVIEQHLEGRTLKTLLVIDATTGQNAINQTEVFNEALGIQGLILTKLDGTAKGGIVLALADQFKIPIYFIGVGEQAEDLQEFQPIAFTKALFD